MPFAIALSGLNAASADLGVTANNVANVNTTGFKESRTEFAEVFAVGTQSVGSTQSGSGVRLSSVAQQFSQGNINFTDNALDLAIAGEGFFVLSDGGARSYTRAGAFGIDNQGNVVNAQGHRLQAYPFAGNGLFNTGTPQDLQFATGANPPQATTTALMGINLPANAPVPPVAVFNSADPQSFNHTTSVTIYDSLGAAHTATVFFIKDAVANTWNTQVEIDGTPIAGAAPITFAPDGSLAAPAGGLMALALYTHYVSALIIAVHIGHLLITARPSTKGKTKLSQ